MKVAFIVNHPTQFEVPFYRWINENDKINHLKVFFLKERSSPIYDGELRKEIDWGFDLYEGYDFVHLPPDKALPLFEQYIDTIGFDLVIINGYKSVYAGFREACTSRGIVCALKLDTVLFNLSWWSVYVRKLLLSPLYHRYDVLFVTGRACTDYLFKMGVPAAKTHIFSYCTNNEFFRKPHALTDQLRAHYNPDNKKVISCVAKFMRRESPWDVLHAFISLNNKSLCLLLVGDGEERPALEKLSRSYPHLSIVFTGYVQYPDLPAYFQMSDIFIHAAQDEPWGVSVQEALAAGCTVICSNKVGAAQDLIQNNVNGFTYTFGRPEELRSVIEASFNLDKAAKQIKNTEVLSRWSYSSMWKNVLDAISLPNPKGDGSA